MTQLINTKGGVIDAKNSLQTTDETTVKRCRKSQSPTIAQRQVKEPDDLAQATTSNGGHTAQAGKNPRHDNASPPTERLFQHRRCRGHSQQQSPSTTGPATKEAKTLPEGFIDIKEMLRRIPVCRKTLWNLCQSEKIPSVKLGDRVIFHWVSVEASLLRKQRGAFQF
jgi:hypothetical protein